MINAVYHREVFRVFIGMRKKTENGKKTGNSKSLCLNLFNIYA